MAQRKQARFPNLRAGVADPAHRAAMDAGRRVKREQARAVEQLARGEDPRAALEQLLPAVMRHLLRQLRDEESSGSRPSREVTSRMAEARQLIQAVTEYRRSAGQDEKAAMFFSELETRLQGAEFTRAMRQAMGEEPIELREVSDDLSPRLPEED